MLVIEGLPLFAVLHQDRLPRNNVTVQGKAGVRGYSTLQSWAVLTDTTWIGWTKACIPSHLDAQGSPSKKVLPRGVWCGAATPLPRNRATFAVFGWVNSGEMGRTSGVKVALTPQRGHFRGFCTISGAAYQKYSNTPKGDSESLPRWRGDIRLNYTRVSGLWYQSDNNQFHNWDSDTILVSLKKFNF